ncbi:hypothetical protein KALB_4867 [Kutzneria albida DSM 43870]|uniref:Uncharacterized protein n=1 Tax=Kutzneria albida DSM 43870 TaxID=1449976 RepID=W5WJ91_9PSEU|nr:hypothetical protein KALB_4867 [Kutzneria albida DSM 43870]
MVVIALATVGEAAWCAVLARRLFGLTSPAHAGWEGREEELARIVAEHRALTRITQDTARLRRALPIGGSL